MHNVDNEGSDFYLFLNSFSQNKIRHISSLFSFLQAKLGTFHIACQALPITNTAEMNPK